MKVRATTAIAIVLLVLSGAWTVRASTRRPTRSSSRLSRTYRSSCRCRSFGRAWPWPTSAPGRPRRARDGAALGPSGRVFATDVNAAQIDAIRDQPGREPRERRRDRRHADLDGSPGRCCDAIFVRDAYRHFTDPAAMNRSFLAALKPGGRLAIIDFEPAPGSGPPPNVPANRTGHGVAATIVEGELCDRALRSFVRSPAGRRETKPTSTFSCSRGSASDSSRAYSSVKLMLTFTRIEIWPGAIAASLESVEPPKLCDTFCVAMP